jgi:two-component system NtrC family sensor kinase
MTDLATPWLMPGPPPSAGDADRIAADAVEHMLDAIALPAWLYRPGQPVRANAALLRLCGRPVDSVAAITHTSLVVPDDRDVLERLTDECLHGDGGEPPALPVRLETSDGGHRPVELMLRSMLWGGHPAALVTCVDYSDFLHAQTMPQGMSNLLQQIVDGAPVASFVIDRHHRVTHWNAACARLTGHGADAMIGSTQPWKAFHAEARPLLADLIVDGVPPDAMVERYGAPTTPSALIAGAFDAEAFFPQMGSDGRWLGFTAAPLRDHDGLAIGAIVTLQDISQRRRTEAELQRQLDEMVEARSAELAAHAQVMDAFIDNAPIGVVYAENNTVLRSNRQMAEIFGPPPGDGPAGFFLHADDRARLSQVARPLLAQGQQLHHEMWMRHADGRPIWVQVNAHVVDHRNRNSGVWWMLQDRTEVRTAQEALHERFEQLQATNQKLEQAQNQLLQNDKMASIGQLAAGVAHEINNPVGFVSSNLNSLRQSVAALLRLADAQAEAVAHPHDTAAAQRAIRLIDEVELPYLKQDLPQLLDESAEGLTRVKKIVQDLKDFSRVDQADWQLADLNAGLESTLNVVLHEVKYKAEVVKALQPLPLVHCLAGQLNQVFMNLIVNASQAITGRGTITLASGAQDGWVWVQVSDTGSGMTEAVMRRIFEPFYTTKDVGKGTGLGLSLSFSIMQRHGGALLARSQPGVGSQFRVWVPVAGPAAGGPATAPQPPAWP